MTGKRAIVNGFTFFDTFQLLTERIGNFIFIGGRFGKINLKEDVIDSSMRDFFIQFTSSEITNVSTETMSRIVLFKGPEKTLGFLDINVRNISSITSSAVASSRATSSTSTTASLYELIFL